MRARKTAINYSLLFIISALFIFSAFWLQGKSLVSYGDNYNQFLPTLLYLKQYYKALISGNGYAFDPAIGFGDDVVGTLSYYGLGDVLLFPILLFDETKVVFIYSFIVILKMWLSGITFMSYCYHKGISGNMLTGAGIAYAFSFYMLQQGMCIFGFLTAPIYFPLLILGIDKIYESGTKRWMLFLAVIVGLQGLNGFYFLYDDIIGCVVYGVLLLIYKPQPFTLALRKVIGVAFAFALGGLLASPVLFSAIWGYFQSKRTGETGNIVIKLIQFPSFSDVLLRLKNLFLPSYGLYEYGFGLTVFVLVVFIWLLKNAPNKKYNKYLFVFILAFFAYFFPAVGIVMNGFSYNTSRWFYMMFFALLYITVKVLPDVAKDFHISKYLTANRCALLLIANVALIGFFFFAPVRIGGKGTAASFMKFDEVQEDLFNSDIYKLAGKYKNSESDSEFYRIDFNDSSLDAPAFMGINSTFLYYSICNGSMMDIFEKLRVSPAINSSHNYEGLDSRQVLESLFSTRAYTDNYITQSLKENKYYLPQGVFFKNAISASEADKLPYLEKSNILMSTLIVDDQNLANTESTSKDACGIQHTIDFSVTGCEGVLMENDRIVAEKGGTLTISFEGVNLAEDYNELYMQIDNLKSDTDTWSDIIIAGRGIRTRPLSEEWYFHNNYDYLVNISSVADEGEVVLEFEHGGTFTFDNISIIANYNSAFEENYKALLEHSLKDGKYSNDIIEGYTDEDVDGYLMINLPYSSRWKCYVDGEKADIIKADWSFMAVKLSKGYHDIKFVY